MSRVYKHTKPFFDFLSTPKQDVKQQNIPVTSQILLPKISRPQNDTDLDPQASKKLVAAEVE